jgi:hypothetical protein
MSFMITFGLASVIGFSVVVKVRCRHSDRAARAAARLKRADVSSSSVPAGVLIASLIAVLYVAIGMWAGLGQSWDSNFYLLFSQDFRLNGRIDFGQGLYAPVYPLLLASLTILGLNSELAMCVVNAGSAGAIFLAAFVAAPRAYRFPTRFVLGCLATAVAIGSQTFRFAWTEPLYTALLMWACLEALRATRRGRVSVALLVLLGLLPLTRFVGLFVSLAIAAYLLLGSRLGQGRTQATEHVSVAAGLVAVAASVGPIALLAASNPVLLRLRSRLPRCFNHGPATERWSSIHDPEAGVDLLALAAKPGLYRHSC